MQVLPTNGQRQENCTGKYWKKLRNQCESNDPKTLVNQPELYFLLKAQIT